MPYEFGIQYVLMISDSVGHIVAGNKYKLTAQGSRTKDIMDIKRFALPPGYYKIDLEATDILDSLNTLTTSQMVDMRALEETVYLSDIALMSAITPAVDQPQHFIKSGMYLEPLPFRFYYPALQELHLYYETYHIDQLAGQPYVQYTIRPAMGEIPTSIVAYKKLQKNEIDANVFQLDIRELISGPYLLDVKLYDGDKLLKATATVPFSRLNPQGDSLYMEKAELQIDQSFVYSIPVDSLDYYIRAMAPIVNSFDVDVMNMLLDKGSEKSKRYFIHRYWSNHAGKYASVAFKSYMDVAKVVDENFKSGFGYGFETDRGHIFLKYGKPDDIIEVEDEPSAPPYEIWFYNSFPATHQQNVRFLFYNPSLGKGAFELLHSTARGEVYNDRWEIELYRDATLETPGVNARKMGDNVYRNARRYFEN